MAMKLPTVRRSVEFLLCLVIAYAFLSLLVWLLIPQLLQWQLQHCIGPGGFGCLVSGAFLRWWWLLLWFLVPACAGGLFVLLARSEPR